MSAFDGQDLDALLAQTRGVLDSLRQETPTDPDAPPARHTGGALEGQVQVVVSAGRLESLTLDPRVLRLASTDLAEEIRFAVNAALGLADAAQEATGGPTVDPAALSDQLRELQDSSVRQMREFGAAMDDVMARMRAARR